MPPSSPQLDARIEIVTPENIAFHYVLAGPFRRLPAYLVDCGICTGLLVASLLVVGLTVGIFGGLGLGAWLVAVFVMSWFYFGLFETLWNGQTPGKRLLGLRVLTVDGQPINAMQAILRNVLRAVDALPVWGTAEFGIPFYMAALASMTASPRYQRLGDLACGTIVVVEQRSRLRGVHPIDNKDAEILAQSLPARVTTGRTLGHALSVYASRRERLSPARRQEIAQTLTEPLCERFNLPSEADADLLLCALYHRMFIADRANGTDLSTADAAVPGQAPVAEDPHR